MPSSLSKIFLLLLLAIALSLGVAAIDTYAATLTVTKTEDTNDGVCDADCSLREAVFAAASGDTVVFSSLFNSPQTITLTLGQIAIDKNLTITGTGQDLITISGNNASRIFFTNGNGFTVNISDITFRDGNGNSPTIGSGGAILFAGASTLNLSNATFTNNRGGMQPGGGAGAIEGANNCILNLSNLVVVGNFSQGTAIASTASLDIRDSIVRHNQGNNVSARTLRVERCLISGDNTGQSSPGVGGDHLTMIDSTITNHTDGGVAVDTDGSGTIERCRISGNRRFPAGGGIYSRATLTIKNSQITNNIALADYGGGILNSNGGDLYLIDSVVSGNRNTGGSFNDDGGGGIVNFAGNSNLFVINSTISGNTAVGSPGVGGGIYSLLNEGSPPLGEVFIVNSTIANNTSSGSGGGVRIDASADGTFSNTIIAGNNSTGTAQEDVSGIIISNGVNLIGNTFGSSGWIGGDLLNLNPLLAPLGNNGASILTHALLPGSPAIDSGNDALAVNPQTMLPLETDQRGRPRFIGGVDIGAHEASYSSSPVIVSGRITTYSGRGIERTRIKLDDGNGDIRYALTNPFGFYRFFNLIPGTTYTITVTHKFYLFTSPQFFTADQNRSDLNFITGL